jgi:ribosomal protein S18 acetylase RimI-like enzyme
MDQAAEKGASELLLAVYEDNERAIRLYQKLGFQQAILSSLEPAFAAEKEQLGRRRIVMRRSLKATP